MFFLAKYDVDAYIHVHTPYHTYLCTSLKRLIEIAKSSQDFGINKLKKRAYDNSMNRFTM
jgi:hypothetical protein